MQTTDRQCLLLGQKRIGGDDGCFFGIGRTGSSMTGQLSDGMELQFCTCTRLSQQTSTLTTSPLSQIPFHVFVRFVSMEQ